MECVATFYRHIVKRNKAIEFDVLVFKQRSTTQGEDHPETVLAMYKLIEFYGATDSVVEPLLKKWRTSIEKVAQEGIQPRYRPE